MIKLCYRLSGTRADEVRRGDVSCPAVKPGVVYRTCVSSVVSSIDSTG